MKKALLSTAVLLSLSASALAAQTQGKAAPVNFPPNPSATKRVKTAKPAAPETDETEKQATNHPTAVNPLKDPAESETVTSDATTKSVNSLPFVDSLDADAPDENSSASSSPAVKPVENSTEKTAPAKLEAANTTKPETDSAIKPETANTTKLETTSTAKTEPPVSTKITIPGEAKPATPNAAKPDPVPTNVYRVGVGDVLDIQLLNSPTRESTLYTVLAGGMLEYPLAGDALQVAGATTEEIGEQLVSKIKLYDNPQVAISVREYASHNVIITGLVHDPGTKALRREAVPLFVVLAEAQPRADAARAVIMRTGSPVQTIDISDTTATSALVYPNDVIRLVGAPPPVPLFFYVGGQIASPGQKDFHPGMTLTQALYASGGVTRSAGSKAKVMRQGADGRLVTTEYNLKKIEQGKDPDPLLEAGDRIEITRGGW